MARRRILVPINFSTQSDRALEYAAKVASSLNAMISCLYVVPEVGIGDNNSNEVSMHRLRMDAEIRFSEKVNSILNKERKSPFELIITSGNVQQKILEKSIDLNARIIVMGRSNTSINRNIGVASITKSVIANSKVPVITITNQREHKWKNLIVPLDLNASYNEQVDWANETALLQDGSVSFIAVIEKENSNKRYKYSNILKEICLSFGEQGIECSYHLIENHTSISHQILTFSNRIDSGIILIMSRQNNDPASHDMGNIASTVLTKTEVPLMFINPKVKIGYSLDNFIPDNQAIFP